LKLSPLFGASLCALVVSLASPAAAQSARQTTPPPASADTPPSADDFHTTGSDIVVTAPYVRSLDLFGTIGVVDGDKLAQAIRPTIGETLASQPGVSATSFSPGASRPVLRGFSGERVRILVDGIGSIDASNTSADHAVAFDSLTAERVEIVRGPASLLFGSSAIGGAVNIFDRRIPRAVPESPAHIDAIAGYGSAADSRQAGASVDVPLTANLVAHLDGAWSKTDDLRIGGYQIAAPLRAEILAGAAEATRDGDAASAATLTGLANQRDRLPNSATRTWSAAGGLAWITDGGSLGVSVSYYDTNYGVPARPPVNAEELADAEAPVTIGMKQWRADFRGEVNLGEGLFETLRIRGGFADYQHTEYEGEEAGTTFTNQGIEARAELVQAHRGNWSGASGVQYSVRDFNAVGEEAFLPRNTTQQFALFTLQELAFGPVGVEMSGRYEHVSVDAPSATYNRSFDAVSGAIGLSHEVGAGSKIGVNLSRVARAPSAEELLSDGPHVATQSYELGNPDFRMERAWSVEGYAKLRLGNARIDLSAYHSWFSNFIYATDIGAVEDGLPVYAYRQGGARYYGFEAQATVPLAQFGGYTLSADAVGDYVRAKLTHGNGDIPRIPPLRLRGGLELASQTLSLRGEVEWSDDQNHVGMGETPSNRFTMVNASASWKPMNGVTLILSGDNLFDVVGRRQASFTKDFVPLSGRDIRLTARFSF
jgi:iron complex outermembrane receptor protein